MEIQKVLLVFESVGLILMALAIRDNVLFIMPLGIFAFALWQNGYNTAIDKKVGSK